MVSRLVFDKYKKTILIFLLIFANMFYILLGNVIVNGINYKEFNDVCAYDELFLSSDSKDFYYLSKTNYIINDHKYIWKNKYVLSKQCFEKVKFKKVSSMVASIVLPLISNDCIIGYCTFNHGNCSYVDIEYSVEDMKDIFTDREYLISGKIYKIFNKAYLCGIFKDNIYEYDKTISNRENIIKTINQGGSVAVFELENFDVESFCEGEKQDEYNSIYCNVFDRGYIIITTLVGLVDVLILVFIIKKRYNNTG